MTCQCPEEYTALKDILDRALAQACTGKGKERHASEGELFTAQPICEISRRLGKVGPLFQAVKKIYESVGLPGPQAIQELLGAIVYTAAAVIIVEEQHQELMTELASEVTGLKPQQLHSTSEQVLSCPLCNGPMNAKDYQYYGKCFGCSELKKSERPSPTILCSEVGCNRPAIKYKGSRYYCGQHLEEELAEQELAIKERGGLTGTGIK